MAAAPAQGTGLQPKKMFNLVNDKLAAGAARLNGGEYQDVDIAIVKATNHDEVPPKEKHVKTLKEAVSSAPSRRKVIYIVHDLYERLKTSGEDWLVVMKTLMVYHRLMKADNQCSFKMEMCKYKDKRKLNTFLRLDNFSDNSKKETWDYSAWVRAYSIYLDTRLEIYRTVSFDLERDIGAGETKLKTAGSRELLDVLPRLQQLMQRVLGCVPEGAAAVNSVVMEALKWVLSECFRLYRAISEGVINLADHFFEMDRVDARKALDIYREAINSTDRLQEYFAKIQNMAAGKALQFPQLMPPPEDFLDQMEAYAKGAPGPAGKGGENKGTVVTRIGTLIHRREDANSTPLTVTTTDNGNSAEPAAVSAPAAADDDLLGFGDLSIDSTPAPQAAVPATAASDPFGDSAFDAPLPAAPKVSVRELPTSLAAPADPFAVPAPPSASPSPSPTNLLDDWGVTNFQSAEPAPAPAQGMPGDPFADLASPMPSPIPSPMPSPGAFPPAAQGFGFEEPAFPPPAPAMQAAFPAPSGGGNPFAMGGGMPPTGYPGGGAQPVMQATQAGGQRSVPQQGYQHRVSDPFGDMLSEMLPA
ncbi:unnamed protein product, partial [Ostreobium quekettii]